jgi:hypothetical protein
VSESDFDESSSSQSEESSYESPGSRKRDKKYFFNKNIICI